MRTIYLSKTDEEYLKKCAVDHALSFGIICGQQAEPDKYIVVHLARNNDEDVDTETEHEHNLPQKVEDINKQALAVQWTSASKMLPGSFRVLGIFIAGIVANLGEETTFKEAKNLMYDVYTLLTNGTNYCTYVDEVTQSDYLFLSYSTATKRAVCQSYSHSSNGGTFTPMDCRFVEKPFEWYSVESSYMLDDVFPIHHEASQSVNIEREFQRTITAVRETLEEGEVFLQDEIVENGLFLDAYLKKLNNFGAGNMKKSMVRTIPELSLQASIYVPLKCQTDNEQPVVKVRQFNGTIRFSGIISSRVWCNPRNTLGDVKRFVRKDILRSLAARIQVYCDGLTNPNISTQAVFVSEPPRRVYFGISSSGSSQSRSASSVQFSEYIFRGEAPTVAVAQAKQILDLDIDSESIITDIEGLPDDESLSNLGSSELFNHADTPIDSVLTKKSALYDLSKTMYTLGVIVALLVLLASAFLHYVLRK